MERLHVVDKGVDEVVRVLLYIDEFEVETSALVRQLGEVLPQEAALAPVQLLVTVALNREHSLLPELAVEKDALTLLYLRKLTLLLLLL